MSYKNISPENLSPVDSFGSIFSTINLKYEYANLSVLHSEVKGQVLRCLSFDTVACEPVYLEVDLSYNYAVNPSVVSRSFTLEDFDCDPLYSGPMFEVNYTELFENNLLSGELEWDEYLHLHLFGISSIYTQRKDVSNSVNLLELTSFKYPGSNFYRLERVFHGKRNSVLKTNEIILL